VTDKTYPEWIRTESEKKLHDDFRYFLWFIWRHLKLPSPTKRQLAIAHFVATGNRRRMVQAWRGAAKTWITCAYALWRLYRNPNERVKIVSANEDKALENAVFIKRLISEIEELKFLRSRSGQRDATTAFDVGPADAHPTPSVSCVGITGQLTGGRATILISDDVEVPKNSLTETMRERLAELIKEYDALVVPEGFDIIYLGTPQTEQSIYKKVRERGYECRVWPVRYPKDVNKYDGALAPDILRELEADPSLVGKSTEPTRFSDLDLAEREGSYGRSGFALQFMLDTSLSDSDRYPLKQSDLIVTDVDNDTAPIKHVWSSDARMRLEDIVNLGFSGDRMYRPMHTSEIFKDYEGRLLVVDPSGRGGDETAWVVVFQLEGTLFLKAWGGFRTGYDDATLDGLAEVAKKYKVSNVLIESNFGDGMFMKLLEPVMAKTYPVTMEEIRATGQKERRIIEDLEPVLNQHRLVIDATAVRQDTSAAGGDEKEQKYSLLYQLTRITKDRNCLRHDDRLDALAHAVRWFRDALARDSHKAEAEHRDKELSDMIDKFHERFGMGHLVKKHGNSFARVAGGVGRRR
jgi:hypothetical protein